MPVRIIAAFCFYMLSYQLSFAADLQPVSLTCEYLQNPIAIEVQSPRFGWTLISSSRNQLQSAYELILSDNEKDINAGKGNIWSSGKQNSSSSFHIEYTGTPLQSLHKYYWRVRVYDQQNQPSGWSSRAIFATAFFNANEWQAKWIGDGRAQPKEDKDYYKDDPMPVFKKQFNASKKIIEAKLFITGLGYYEAYLNGQKIGDHILDPGFTTFRKEVYYVVYDITSLLKKGINDAGIMLGNGWWNPLPFRFFGRWDLRDYQQSGRPCVKAEFHIRYADGSVEKILTDESWQASAGPVLRNNVYLGEHYDARLETPKNWAPAVVVPGPSGKLSVQSLPPIRTTNIVHPKSITKAGEDTFMVNLGQNFAGVARIKVKGPAGTKITLRYGEGLFPDGRLNVLTTAATQIKKGAISGGPGAPETAWQEDSYTLKGDGLEVWAPKFTFHGFQYVEITGWPGVPTLESIEGLRRNTDLLQNGNFSCSNDMFNQLHEAAQWTFLSNVFSVQSDCPGREKFGYGGDLVATANSFIYNYDMLHFYNKAVNDFANEQRPQGGITEIAPFVGIDDRGLGDLSGPLGWQLAYPFLQKQLYDFYGDKRIIEKNYEAFKKQLAFLQAKSIDNTFYWDISDHEALDPKPEALSAASFYYHHILLGVEFAKILGHQQDVEKYEQLAATVKSTTTGKFWVPGSGRFDNSTQSAQIFALYYGLSPEKDATVKVLLDEFARHNWHLSTGIFSTRMLFNVLRELNRNDVAYRIANQRDFPGWGYMLANGATTLWETWAFPEADPSRNHPMFGSFEEWFYRSLAGINPAAPGFTKIIIKPQPAGDLTWVKASYQSITGKIVNEWNLTASGFDLKVSIPANTRALVYCPSGINLPVTESGNPVKILRYEDGYAVIDCGSGDYQFKSAK